MKTYLTIFSIASTIIACATPETARDIAGLNYRSDNRLTHYIESFLSDCRLYLSERECDPPIDLQVTVTDLDELVLGQCTVYANRLRLVQIDRATLNQYNERTVMYHELYHCVLGKPHVDGELDIMNTYEVLENTQQIYANWSFYVGKVFLRE